MADPYSPGSNPYLGAQANAITQQATQNLQLNQLPGISSGAVAAGGYGGSRQGIAEGVATGLTNQGITNSLASLYGNQYQQDQQNALQQQSINNQYNLGLGGLGLNNQLQNYNFYTQNRGLDQSGAALGANLYNQGNAGYVGQGTGVTGIGNTQQQAPWNVTNNAGNAFNQFSGLGGGQINTQNGSALGGAVGGALIGQQAVSNLGLGTSQPNPYTTPGSTGSYQNPSMPDYGVNYGNPYYSQGGGY